MTKQPITQSEKRFLESLGAHFTNCSIETADYIFMKSSTDIGVERNLGRNGARFAPQSFLNHFKKLNSNPYFSNQTFTEIEVSDENLERENFDQAQLFESQKISKIISSSHLKSKIIHLGGGHDHIYPLLRAVNKISRSVVVLNVDAHTDTRIDSLSNSGTPFRQFDEEFDGEFHLFQIGIQEFANSQTTLSPLKNGKSKTLFLHEMHDEYKYRDFLSALRATIRPETHFILSIDVDALDGSFAPGVSAVNGTGLSNKDLLKIFDDTQNLGSKRNYLGLYEMNPVYDSVSLKTIRTISNWLYEIIQK